MKMIQHTHYDRKLGKYVKTAVPQSKEHAARSKSIIKAISQYKEPSPEEKREHQRRFKRAYNE